jgi:hypothetical protein
MDQPAARICARRGRAAAARRADLVPVAAASMPMSASTTRPHLRHRRHQPVRGLQRAEGDGQVEVRERRQQGAIVARRRSAGRRRRSRCASRQLAKAVQLTASSRPRLEAGSEQAIDQQRRRFGVCEALDRAVHCRPIWPRLGLGQRRDPHRIRRARRGAARRHSRRRHCCPARTGSASGARAGEKVAPPRPAPPRPLHQRASTLVPRRSPLARRRASRRR